MARRWLNFEAGRYGRRAAMRGPLLAAVLAGCLQGSSACRSSDGRAHPDGRLQFRDDGYEPARAEAIRKGVPLFVDVWASWCHTCMSMKEFVLPDPALGKLRDSFVWLSLDSEKAQNAPFLDRFKTGSLPTLWVIDPRSQQPLLKWIGAATVSELVPLLEAARRELRSESSSDASGNPQATALWVRANRASAAGEGAEAIRLYREAILLAHPTWDKRAPAIEALSMRLAEADRHRENLDLAAREAPNLAKGTALVNLLVNGISAATQLPEEARGQLPALLRLAIATAQDPDLPVLLDDRSSLYLNLVQLLRRQDPAEARRLATAWSQLLDRAAARARTPEARRVWDPHRLEAYLLLEQPERALPMLERSQREEPSDFNPPARLARTYLVLEQVERARQAIDRALARCDGPRKLRLYMLKADIQLADNDRNGARTTLDEALVFARSAKLPAQYEALRQVIERRALELS